MNKNPFFEFNNSFMAEYLNDMKEMMREFHEEFGLNFQNNQNMSVMYKPSNFIPTELWETKEQLFISVYLVGVDNIENIEVSVKDVQRIYIRVNYNFRKPAANCKLIESELPDYIERDIILPQPIKENNFAKKLENGLLSITLNKEVEDFDLPIDF